MAVAGHYPDAGILRCSGAERIDVVVIHVAENHQGDWRHTVRKSNERTPVDDVAVREDPRLAGTSEQVDESGATGVPATIGRRQILPARSAGTLDVPAHVVVLISGPRTHALHRKAIKRIGVGAVA